MATATWVFDIPSGVWKNRALSSELRRAAVSRTTFVEHSRTERAFGRKSGESVTIPHAVALTEPTTAEFGETQLIPEESLTFRQTTITVKRLGRAVVFTEDMQVLSKYDPDDTIQALLRDQMAQVLDTMAASAYKATNIRYTPTGAATATITNNGSFGAAATTALTLYHVENLRDLLYDTLRAPFVDGNHYILIGRTKAIRGLLRDADFKDWYKYTDPEAKYRLEKGALGEMRIIETNHEQALKSGSVAAECIAFGDDAMTMIEAVTPELRMGIPRNFGLLRGIAWYGMMNFGLTWQPPSGDWYAGENRVVYVGGTSLS